MLLRNNDTLTNQTREIKCTTIRCKWGSRDDKEFEDLEI